MKKVLAASLLALFATASFAQTPASVEIKPAAEDMKKVDAPIKKKHKSKHKMAKAKAAKKADQAS